MNRKNKKYYFLAVIVLLFVLTSSFAYAAAIDVDFPAPSGPIITETNILPGDVFTRTVTITKLNDDSNVGLMLRLDRMNPTGIYNLESKILFKIQRLSDSVFLPLPGSATEKTLESLYDYLDFVNNDAFQFDSISGPTSSTYQYKLWFTFDPLTGNNYQGKSTTFDILMGIYSTEEDDDGGHSNSNGDGGGDNDNGNGGGGGAPPILGFAGLTGTAGPVEQTGGSGEEGQGEEVAGTAAGITEGASVEACQSWPLWVWILAFIVFVLGLFLDARKKYKKTEYGWKFMAVWTAAAAAFWYFFDFCREYRWFLYFAVIIALAIHFIYLELLKRKIKKQSS